jgi:very-short-patch-repair endonuclease
MAIAQLSAAQHGVVSIAQLAAAQHGVVSIAQLVAAGISKHGAARRAKAGWLHRVHRGVYAVGYARLTEEGQWWAAILAIGERAILSHLSAAALWNIRPQSSGPVHVMVPGRGGRAKRRGVTVHHSVTLTADELTRRHGIPVTSPARTIADLRRVLSPDDLHAAIRKVEILRLDIGPQPGFEPDEAKSKLERLALRVCREQRVPEPEVNVWIGKFQVDLLWRARRLIVELDSWQFHGTRSAFESDRARDVALKLLGYDVVRFTWRQVKREPKRVAADLRTLLGA